MLEAIDSRGCVTAIGSDMSNFPLEPTISRMLIQATHRLVPSYCIIHWLYVLSVVFSFAIINGIVIMIVRVRWQLLRRCFQWRIFGRAHLVLLLVEGSMGIHLAPTTPINTA